MLFVVIAIDKENALSLRLATREAHFAYAATRVSSSSAARSSMPTEK